MATIRKTRLNKRKSNGIAYVFKGEKDAFPLVQFLNMYSESNVHDIVRECLRLDEIAMGLDWSVQRAEQLQQWNDYANLASVIFHRLTNYTTCPSITINGLVRYPDGFRKIHEQRGPYFWSHSLLNTNIPQNSSAGIALLGELGPLLSLEKVMTQGLVSRLRVCDVDDCKKWFFARKESQLYCSRLCGQRRYDHSPKAMQRRKSYLALEKNGRPTPPAPRPHGSSAI
jgi:hypothetical protein